MIRHEFREEKSSLGKVLRPVAEVILEKDDFKVGMLMYMYMYRPRCGLNLTRRYEVTE
jgi:hypothetical protein